LKLGGQKPTKPPTGVKGGRQANGLKAVLLPNLTISDRLDERNFCGWAVWNCRFSCLRVGQFTDAISDAQPLVTGCLQIIIGRLVLGFFEPLRREGRTSFGFGVGLDGRDVNHETLLTLTSAGRFGFVLFCLDVLIERRRSRPQGC